MHSVRSAGTMSVDVAASADGTMANNAVELPPTAGLAGTMADDVA